MNILFVCLGNICRSVTAETIFRQMVDNAGIAKQFAIDSAGLINYHEGELADPRMRHAAAARGYRLTHRSRPVTHDDFRHFNLIVAMDAANVRGLRAIAPTPQSMERVVLMANYLRHHDASSIPDPYYGNAADFDHVIDLLEDACKGLLEAVSKPS